MKTRTMNGLALAAVAATLFTVAPIASAHPAKASNSVGQCFGVNACKGHGSCKSADHACKGQNSCKGKGFIQVSKHVCDQLGGKFKSGMKG